MIGSDGGHRGYPMYERFVDEVFDELTEEGAAAYDEDLFMDRFVDRSFEEGGFERDTFDDEYSDWDFGDWDAIEEEACRGFEIDSKNYIRWVQRSLNRNVGSSLPATGEISPEYRLAVMKFQVAHGITPTGDIDEKTQNKLINTNESDPKYVMWVQRALNTQRYGLVADGVMGSNQSRTKKAIRDFQQKRVPDLCVDGYVGAKTELRLIQTGADWPPGHIEPRVEPKGPRKPKPRTPDEPQRPEDPLLPFVNCEIPEKPDLIDAWRAAKECLVLLRNRLDDLSIWSVHKRTAFWNHADNPEQKWFGKYDAARFQRVRWIISGALEALRSEALLVFCASIEKHPRTCRRFAAFVPKRGRNLEMPGIWLCPSFLKSSPDEKVYMFIHEAAHLAGADKLSERYRSGAVRRLARRRPNAAVMNAQNHAFYAAEICLSMTF